VYVFPDSFEVVRHGVSAVSGFLVVDSFIGNCLGYF
jgi:hypothetical protein